MEYLQKFAGTRVLVVGDVMLDRYWWGGVTRISPEAPVPVVKMKTTSVAPGGAANVAVNIAGLGGVPYLVGIVGDDAEGASFPDVLRDCNVSGDHLIKLSSRPTTVKTRLVAHGQQVARIDHESDEMLSSDEEKMVFARMSNLIESCGTIVISDYAKGFLTDSLLRQLIHEASRLGKTILVDPKGKNYSKYRGATILTPNKREALDACSFDDDSDAAVDAAGQKLMDDLQLDAILITQGEDGMTLFQRGESPHHQHARARQVFDVTGAGDTVIATLAVGIASGLNLLDAANVANLAASLVVEKVGTTPVLRSELEDVLREPEK